MGDDLAGHSLQPTGIGVELVDSEAASGLADMLYQYISQNLEESPRKCSQARTLRGRMVFQAAEDEEVCVQILFEPGRVKIEDTKALTKAVPSITADFLSISALTTGEAGAFSLLWKRKMRAHFSVQHIPFLLRALRFMQVPPEADIARGPSRWIVGALAIAIVGVLISWLVYS